VSQLFDSLRRGRGEYDRSNATRTAQGDAVLATLGYSSQRRNARSAVVLAVVLVLGLVGAVWVGWHNYMGDSAGPASALRATAPSLPRNAPPRPIPDETSVPESAPRRPSTPSRPAATREQATTPTPPDSSTRPAQASTPEARQSGPDSPRSATASASTNELELAVRFQRAGDFNRARQHYRALLERNELDAQAHNNLGLLYQEQGLLNDSLLELQRAVAIEPRHAGTRNNYGVTLLMLGRTDEAVAEFRSALNLEPGNLDARVNLALAERSAGQLDRAKETLLDVLNRAPANAPAHYNLAQLYDQTNEPARAVEHYRLFLEHAGAEHSARAAPVRARIAALSKMPE
jgi:Tfp pilus assembly protein PilF